MMNQGFALHNMRIMAENEQGNENHNHDDGGGESSATTTMMTPYSPEFWKPKKEYINAVQRYLQSREEEGHQKNVFTSTR